MFISDNPDASRHSVAAEALQGLSVIKRLDATSMRLTR
jgi:hypothetical protein